MLAQIVSKNSYLLEPLNRILLRFLASGLIEKWSRDTKSIFDLDNQEYVRATMNEPTASGTVLGLDYLVVAFILLGVGLFISSGVFLFEVCYPARKTASLEIRGV